MLSDKCCESITVWLFGAGGTPSEKLIRVDYDPDDDGNPSSFQVALSVLSDFAPTFVAPGYTMRLSHDLDKPSVLLRLEPRKSKAVGDVGLKVRDTAASLLSHG
jgi:hypothetical protein